MTDVLYLAWRYLAYHPGKSAVLMGSISLTLFLPGAVHVIVDRAAEILTERADQTPLLIGARGSAVDLTMSALYFSEPSVTTLPFGEVETVDTSGLATAIPLNLAFSAAGHRIVGTSPDYFELRGLEVRSGRGFALLGEALLGSKASAKMGAQPGDAIFSSPTGAFDLAGGSPLRLTVAGVLAPSGTPDDDAVFVDVKTTWVIAGIGHGHDDVAGLEKQILEHRPGTLVAGPALLPYTEITLENIAAFHFHGDQAGFPVHAIIAVPRNARSETILRGRYTDGDGMVQAVVPLVVINDVVATMFSVRNAALLVTFGLGLATVAISALVFALSIRLRRREIDTMQKLGAPRGRLVAVLGMEVLGIVLAAGLVAAILTACVSRFGATALRFITA